MKSAKASSTSGGYPAGTFSSRKPPTGSSTSGQGTHLSASTGGGAAYPRSPRTDSQRSASPRGEGRDYHRSDRDRDRDPASPSRRRPPVGSKHSVGSGRSGSHDASPRGRAASGESAEERELRFQIDEAKEMFEQKWSMEASIAELRARLEGKEKQMRDTPQRHRFPDFASMTIRDVQDLLGDLDREHADLQAEEQRLEKEILMSSVNYKRRAHIRPPTSSSRSRSERSPRDDGGPLTAQERECVLDTECLLGQESNWGLNWNRKWQDQPMGPKDENHRRNRREGTKQRVVDELGLKEFGDAAWGRKGLKIPQTDIHVFLDKTTTSRTGIAAPGGKYLLGRFDVACVKVNADYDRSWSSIKGHRSDFWVAHAAALNIGESTKADDYEDFSITEGPEAGRLDCKAYYKAMEHVMTNVTHACSKLKCEHFVFFPFGMGAFLRHLETLDDRFASFEELQRLRRRLARSFVYILSKNAPDYMHIHLCLMFGSEESQCNADALLRAFASETSEGEKLRHRITVYPEGESLSLAQDLAERSPNVILLNGANRQLLGNHWFAGRAKLAIDENLHRRSWKMAATSYLLNGFDGQEPEGRHQDTLMRNASKMKGKVYVVESRA